MSIMLRVVRHSGVICLGLVVCGALHAASAPPEHYQGPDANSVRAKSTMQRENPWIVRQIQDTSFVTRHRIPYDRVDMSQVAKPNQVGVGIELTSSERFANFRELNWRRHPSGHYAAVIAYTVEQAVALRIALNLADFPEKLTVKFISADPNKPYPEASLDYAKASEYLNRGVSVHWSPIHSGDTLHIELNYPDTTEAGFAAKRIELPGISYIFADGPWGRKKKQGTYKKATEEAVAKARVPATCGAIDVSCDTPGLPDEAKENFSRATGYLVISNTAAFETRYCTGHLIADKDPSTALPYFLSAGHCFFDNMGNRDFTGILVYWDYRSNSCGGNAEFNSSLPTADATILSRRLEQDWAFLILGPEDNPAVLPPNRYFLGWRNDPPRIEETLLHIGHSARNPQSYAQGSIILTDVAICVDGDISGENCLGLNAFSTSRMIRVEWSDGLTAGGTSGSVLVEIANGNRLYARSGGVSSGNHSRSCPVNGRQVDYGNLDAAAPFSLVYPRIREYIDNPPVFPDWRVDLVSVDPLDPLPEALISISVTVRNADNTTTNSTTLRYYLSDDSAIDTGDTQLCTASVSSTPAGGQSSESDTCRLPESAAAGRNYWIGACADATDNESDTGNNCSDGRRIAVRHPSPTTASIMVSDGRAAEGRNGSTAAFTIRLDKPVPPASAGVTAGVRFELSGSATLSGDYNLSATGAVLDAGLRTLTFRAGEQSATVTLAPVNDNVVEMDETARLDFSALGDLIISGANPVVITIEDDDAPAVISLETIPSPVFAGRDVRVSPTLDKPLSGSLTVTIAVAGSRIGMASPASAGDYTLDNSTVVIPAGQTMLNNAATIHTSSDTTSFEAFTVRIDATSLSALVELDGQRTSASVIISEDADLVLERFDADPLLIPETGGTGTFTVQLAGPIPAGSTVTAVYQLPEIWQGRSTAMPGTDYEDIRSAGSMETAGIRGTGEFIIPAESVAASVSISTIDDNIMEPNKPIVVTITGLRRGNTTLPVSGDHNTAVMRIKDSGGILVRVRVFLEGAIRQ